MKALLIIISSYIILTNGKLLERSTEKNYNTKPTESLSSQRISRQAFYDEGIGTSIEDYHRNYVRKERYSIKDHNYSEEALTKNVRVSRDSAEERTETKKPTATTVATKVTKVLVKKPIPKFNAVEYEDFQLKVSALPNKVADSGEHEDEDFSLDDYEFDVNHDEFAGRGKPLEPRRKYKGTKQTTEALKRKPTTTPAPEIKIQSKLVIPASPSSNVKRSAIKYKAADKMKEDYYDDITTTKLPETTTKDSDDEFSDESGSREYNQKAIRTIRSPWNVIQLADKVGGKSAKVVADVLTYLPLFPEAPNSNEDKIFQGPNLDPMTGKEFIL